MWLPTRVLAFQYTQMEQPNVFFCVVYIGQYNNNNNNLFVKHSKKRSLHLKNKTKTARGEGKGKGLWGDHKCNTDKTVPGFRQLMTRELEPQVH